VASAENHLEQDISVKLVKGEIIPLDAWLVEIGDYMVKKHYTKTKMFIHCLNEIFGEDGEKLEVKD
jgi:hypothetical protein